MTASIGVVRRTLLAACALLTALAVIAISASSAAAETTTFSATETIPVPPASSFAGSSGGDGWAVALSETAVYNVFHHNPFELIVACHEQSNAEACAGWPKTISEPGGSQFTSQPQPGMYLDHHTGKLYVFSTRISDDTGGVLCVDTTSTEADPYCGFTELTGKGEAPVTTNRGISGMSNPMLIGSHLYSFNFAEGTQKGTENDLTCFDVSSDAPCAKQPYAVTIGAGKVTTRENEPIGETAAIGDKAIIPLEIEEGGTSASWIACWDDASQGSCAGHWPIKLSFPYTERNGAPFPLLDGTGKTIGICLPTGEDQCFNLAGESVATPPGMGGAGGAIPATEEWNGPALALGPRVYLPNGDTDQVDCYDYSTGKGCTNFPRSFSGGLSLLYTVNADPQRPTCIWVNSDSGQIQNFDAYTGEACGQGTIRVLGSQFVVPQPQCIPASYISLQVLKPAPGSYEAAKVAFADGDGNPIGLPELTLDGSGSASLAGLELNTPTGLPQFLITLTGEKEVLGAVEVKLTWTGNYSATCLGERTTIATTSTTHTTTTPSPPALPKSGVLAFGTAHLARSPRACVASSGYLAQVSGRGIASVSYTLDGHHLATVKHANSHGAYTLHVHVTAGRQHHLSMKVTFTSASHTASVTLRKTLARCAAVHHVVKPRFTG